MTTRKQNVQKRDLAFAQRTITRIWQEQPTEQNPYLAENCRCHGYDLLALARERSFFDILFLLFQGELPSKDHAQLLETLMIVLINPGPRHPATRAAMNAGVGKTDPGHILPIGLSVLSGDHLGGGEVTAAMKFFRKGMRAAPEDLAASLLAAGEDVCHPFPGFGSCYGGIDPMPGKAADLLCALPGSGKALHWGTRFAKALQPHSMGWLTAGVAAAVYCDLAFLPRAGAGLFQLMCAPGLLAHGLEVANKPITAMPFLDEDHYVIEPEARKR